MKKYVEDMRKYEENMKEYAENKKEYPSLYRLWNLEQFRALPLYVGFGTWKNSGPPLPVWALGLQNISTFLTVQALARYVNSETWKNRASIGSGIWKSETPSEVRSDSSYIAFSFYKGSATWKNSNPLFPLGLIKIPSPP